jgi:hypothetical protein
VTAARCGNCGAELQGPWCAQCGQHAHASARGFAALWHDGWHTLTHLDGRLWATIWALLLRPGRLTSEYFAERRQRYLPPVRLYLVLSVVFFALVNFGPPGARDRVSTVTPSEQAATAAAGRCEPDLGVAWIDGLIRRGCQNALHGNSRELSEALRRNIPRMMFVFLPLLAAVMLMLYWRPRRLYIEHLVLCVHNHAALYLVFVLLAGLRQLAAWFAALAPLATAGTWCAALYAPWYVWRSMRRYYGQGWLLTFSKFVLLGIAYVGCLALTLLGAAFVSLLQT